jgi:hypothetical protein
LRQKRTLHSDSRSLRKRGNGFPLRGAAPLSRLKKLAGGVSPSAGGCAVSKRRQYQSNSLLRLTAFRSCPSCQPAYQRPGFPCLPACPRRASPAFRFAQQRNCRCPEDRYSGSRPPSARPPGSEVRRPAAIAISLILFISFLHWFAAKHVTRGRIANCASTANLANHTRVFTRGHKSSTTGRQLNKLECASTTHPRGIVRFETVRRIRAARWELLG